MALTKEEKKAKKEAKKIEKLKAETEARKQAKRLELQRELASQARKKSELDKTWRELMLKIKEPLFKKDIEIMWHTFERAYDKKDHFINHTMKLMDVADDQFQRTVASFCNTIDNMINKFLSDLEQLSKDNDQRTAELLKSGEDDEARITLDHNAAEAHLQLLLYHAHTTADNLAWTTRGENLVKQDEDSNKYFSERENLRSILENRYNSVWEEYKAVLKAYVVETADNQKKVRKLRRRENLMADIIDAQSKKIANSDGILKRLRNELAAYESGTKQAVFRDRRNRHRTACHKLKRRLINGCALDLRQMATLVKCTDKTIEWLESAAKNGDKILRMAALCRKFESQREKVLPYGSTEPHSPTQLKTIVRQTKSDDSLIINAISSTCGLTRLWQRLSKAELVRRALEREKNMLEFENAYILQKIQEQKENQSGPEIKQCKCDPNRKKGTVNRPVAIDGVFEVNKYKLI